MQTVKSNLPVMFRVMLEQAITDSNAISMDMLSDSDLETQQAATETLNNPERMSESAANELAIMLGEFDIVVSEITWEQFCAYLLARCSEIVLTNKQ